MHFTVEQHIALPRVGSLAASPCGTWLAVAVQRLDRERSKYVSDLWRLPLDGSAPVQLTRGDCNDVAPFFRADGALGFLSNRPLSDRKADDGDDQRMQLWLLPAGGGEPRCLTDEPLGVDSFLFARKAKVLVAFAPVLLDVPFDKQREHQRDRDKHGPSVRRYTTQPVRHWDHWLDLQADRPVTHLLAFDDEGGDRRDLTPQARGEFAIEPAFDVSDDGRRVVATRRSPGHDREDDVTLLVIDMSTAQQTVLGAAPGILHDSVRFSPDGSRLATVRSLRSPVQVMKPTLMVISVDSGAESSLGENWDRWPALAGWRGDGQALYVTADDQAMVGVFRIDVAEGEVHRLVASVHGGSHGELTVLADGPQEDHKTGRKRNRLAGVRSTLLSAPEVFVLHDESEATPKPLATLTGFGTKATASWAEVERFSVRAADGVVIESLITRRKDAQGAQPVLLWIHGGPIGMSADGWHWRWNPLLAAAAGFTVVQPNPRGSTGYGQDFVQGIWGNVWGAACFTDLMAVTDALAARGDMDPHRMVAMGGSFGGYMTNWIGTQTERFRALVTHASVVGMSTFTGVTDHPPWWYLEMGGENPYEHADRFDRYAPWRHVQRWKTPALILHGEHDYRCPISEALMLFEALQFHGVPSELVVFPDENHWILKPRNIVAWYGAVFDFLARHCPSGEKIG